MKRHVALSVGIFAIFCVAAIFSSAQAALINVDFNGPDLDTTMPLNVATQTGAAAIGTAGDKWNGVGGNSNTGVALVDSTNAATGVTMDFTSFSGADVGASSTFSTSSPVYPLMRDLLITLGNTDVETVTLHGLAAGTYDLYLYSNSDTPPIAQARITHFTANGTFGDVGPNLGSGTLTAGLNYLLLTPTVTGSGLLTITYTNANTADNIGQLNGFQLNPVPEPSSWVLFCLGAAGLFAAVRRRRKA